MLYRKVATGYEVLLVHPGGPFWAKKDNGSWSIPKGEVTEGEELELAAKREFAEEVGSAAPEGVYTTLSPVKYGNKIVHAFALESDFDLKNFKSNTFELEWPPKSGNKQQAPENDKAAWVSLGKAKQKLVKGQVSLIEQLFDMLSVGDDDDTTELADSPQTTLF